MILRLPVLRVLASVAVATLAPISVRADESSTGLAAFAFEGMKFAITTIADFQRRYPVSVLEAEQSEEKVGVKCFLAIQMKSADGARVYFLDGKLYKIEIVYNADRINKMGGADPFVKKLLTSFGIPNETEQKKIIWNQPDVGRRAEFGHTDSAVALRVVDTHMEAIANERRAKSLDLGF